MKIMRFPFCICLIIGYTFSSNIVFAQKKEPVQLIDHPTDKYVEVKVGNERFTDFLYQDTLYKPVLFPVYAPGGEIITRGYPITPRNGEPTDHPHHQGIWFNYENVNGLDFWNNSFAIPLEKKANYGAIKNVQLISLTSGKNAELHYSADWVNNKGHILLKEDTRLQFSAYNNINIIDRVTTLTAQDPVSFKDAKDGLLGIRVAKELQIPTMETRQFKDDKGIITVVKALKDSSINGNYLTSEGKEGDSAWATRGNWCLLYGRKGGGIISVAVIDHPANPGYPTYWHARGYGLFAANPLGQQIFSNGKQQLNYQLNIGQSAVFKYRIVIANGNKRLENKQLDRLAADFSTK